MSKLSVLVALAIGFIANVNAPKDRASSSIPEPVRASRLEELTALGYQSVNVPLEVLKTEIDPQVLQTQFNPYAPKVRSKIFAAVAKPASNAFLDRDVAYPIGSPDFWIVATDASGKAIKAQFTSAGECVLSSHDSFGLFMSEARYIPNTEVIAPRIYYKESSPLLDTFLSLTKKNKNVLLGWRVFKGDRPSLLYKGTPWNPSYAVTKNATASTELSVLEYVPVSGLTADNLMEGSVGDVRRFYVSSDLSGQVTFHLDGYMDPERPGNFISDAVYSKMCIPLYKTKGGKFFRHQHTIHAVMASFPEFRALQDYIGICDENYAEKNGETEDEKGMFMKNEDAYRKLYSDVQIFLSSTELDKQISLEDLFKATGLVQE